MPRWDRHEPRRLPLRKSDEKRTTALLSRLPKKEPEIVIRPTNSLSFDFFFREGVDGFIPLEIGAQALHADYGVTGGILWAEYQTVPRRVRVRGLWTLEVYEAGGSYLDDTFEIISYGRNYWRVDTDRTYLFHPEAPNEREYEPRHLTKGRIEQIDAYTLEGPDCGKLLLAGHSIVSVGGSEFDCMRVLNICPDPEDPQGDRIQDVYINAAGRTELSRTYVTPEFLQADEDWTPSIADPLKLLYNGRQFERWFDTLTGVSLKVNPSLQ